MRKLAGILSVIFLFTSCVSAQNYTSKSKKAIKAYEAGIKCYSAMDAFGRKDNECIEKNFSKAIEIDKTFLEAYMMLAQHYMDIKSYAKAASALKASHEINPDFFVASWFLRAEMEFKAAQYEAAYTSIIKYYSYNRVTEDVKADAELLKASCEFAIDAIKKPIQFNLKNLGPGVNTKFPEYFPTITGDDQMLLFTRRIDDSQAMDGMQEDFFYSMNVEGTWDRAVSISNKINTSYNEGAPSLSPDGRILIFTACSLMESGNYGENRTGYGSCDLFGCQKIGNEWSRPMNLGNQINSYHWETQPSFSADGKTIYYIRGTIARGGNHSGDIVFSTLDENGYWGRPQRLPDYINTPKDECSVMIHPDGQTLYFSSNGHPGMGGFDLYVCRKQDDGSWSEPVNLGYPLNTSNDENSLLVASNGKIAFFASDRPGGYGQLDLYSFELDKSIQPVATTYMKGKVYDSKTTDPLEARFELIDLSNGELLIESYSDKINGQFLVNIATNKQYALAVEKDGYWSFSKNFSFPESKDKEKVYLMDVPLVPVTDTTPVRLDNVFFDTDKFDLRTESFIELDKLVYLLKKNDKTKIELHGHTDNVGDKKHNMTLSLNRAKSVMNYLISKGVDAKRLSAKGFGDTKPVDTNDTPEGRQNNRRTEYVTVK